METHLQIHTGPAQNKITLRKVCVGKYVHTDVSSNDNHENNDETMTTTTTTTTTSMQEYMKFYAFHM